MGLGDDSPINYTHFTNNGFDTMKTCAGLDFASFKSLTLNRDRTIRPENQFNELCVVNSSDEYTSGDKLVLTSCDAKKSKISNRMKYLWKHDSRTGLVRSIGSVQKNRFFQLCWSYAKLADGLVTEFEQVEMVLAQCDTQDVSQIFEVTAMGVLKLASDGKNCVKIKSSIGAVVVGMQCF